MTGAGVATRFALVTLFLPGQDIPLVRSNSAMLFLAKSKHRIRGCFRTVLARARDPTRCPKAELLANFTLTQREMLVFF
jgi:hypothetical protein